MKTFVKNLILLAALTFTTHATAYDFMVDGLCYNINSDSTTVTVTHENNSTPYYSSLSGDIVIPEEVSFDNVYDGDELYETNKVSAFQILLNQLAITHSLIVSEFPTLLFQIPYLQLVVMRFLVVLV